MKFCLRCNALYNSLLKKCSVCGYHEKLIDGFPSYAPDLAYAGGGFEAEYFPRLAELENNNFWFRARNKLIIWALEKYCNNFSNFLEIGCGTGYVLSGVSEKFKNANLMGSDIFSNGLHYASQRIKSAELIQMDARKIPFFQEFDLIGAFDVLEHIKEDADVLNEIYKALKPNGHLVLTVPQHPWLWSSADEYARHERRYSVKELHEKLLVANFTIIRSTSFVSFLLPLMFFSRKNKMDKNKEWDIERELKISWMLNQSLYIIMYIEQFLIKYGLNFGAGGSRFVVAQKSEKFQ